MSKPDLKASEDHSKLYSIFVVSDNFLNRNVLKASQLRMTVDSRIVNVNSTFGL